MFPLSALLWKGSVRQVGTRQGTKGVGGREGEDRSDGEGSQGGGGMLARSDVP